MQNVNNFTPSPARIGFDRVFIKAPQLDPNLDDEVDESDKFEGDTSIDSTFIENILLKNSSNLNKYKNEGCPCIYNEKLFEFPNNIIFFSDLLNIISDDNTEILIDKYKGKWIDSINQMIQIENLKSFSENIYKFDPKCPLNLQFESRFESGNLRMAINVDYYEYDLILNNDVNSGKTSNWFYFKLTLRNTGRFKLNETPIKLKFNIINCQKQDTLFSKGLIVLSYSSNFKKWCRKTKNNYYFLNGLTIEEKKLYTLTYSYVCDYNFNEEVLYFSYCYPYTYTNLQNYLSSLLNNQIIIKKNILRHEIIGKSLSENNLDMIIITKFDSNFQDIAFRPCIVLTSRVHPGESNASYAIQGVIDFLLDFKNPIAEKLRKTFIFKIIPMLNPDGVINGNFRTSLIGKDLNRLWDDPKENVCPTIFHTKEMIKKTLVSREIFLFCDFHGHSNKPNFFLYGCPTSRKLRTHSNLTYQEMVLSRIYSGKNDIFDHKSCIYKIALKKMKTARAVVKNELNVELSYCLESSIGYISLGENKFCFFTPKKYLKIGIDFCLSLFDLINKEIFNDCLQKIQLEESNRIHLNNLNANNTTVMAGNSNNVTNFSFNSNNLNLLNQNNMHSFELIKNNEENLKKKDGIKENKDSYKPQLHIIREKDPLKNLKDIKNKISSTNLQNINIKIEKSKFNKNKEKEKENNLTDEKKNLKKKKKKANPVSKPKKSFLGNDLENQILINSNINSPSLNSNSNNCKIISSTNNTINEISNNLNLNLTNKNIKNSLKFNSEKISSINHFQIPDKSIGVLNNLTNHHHNYSYSTNNFILKNINENISNHKYKEKDNLCLDENDLEIKDKHNLEKYLLENKIDKNEYILTTNINKEIISSSLNKENSQNSSSNYFNNTSSSINLKLKNNLKSNLISDYFSDNLEIRESFENLNSKNNDKKLLRDDNILLSSDNNSSKPLSIKKNNFEKIYEKIEKIKNNNYKNQSNQDKNSTSKTNSNNLNYVSINHQTEINEKKSKSIAKNNPKIKAKQIETLVSNTIPTERNYKKLNENNDFFNKNKK